MKTRLLRKLRKKYSKGYEIVQYGSRYEIVKENYVFMGTLKSKEEALERIRSLIRYAIEEYIKNTLVRKLRSRNVAYEILYGDYNKHIKNVLLNLI